MLLHSTPQSIISAAVRHGCSLPLCTPKMSGAPCVGAAFALAWVAALFDWLSRLAESGAQIGTAQSRHPGFRSFGYRRQATILAEFAGGELRVVRVYFAGQDWTSPG